MSGNLILRPVLILCTSARSLASAQVADPKELLQCLRDLVLLEGLPIRDVIPLFTQNPAARLKLRDKGSVSARYQLHMPSIALRPIVFQFHYETNGNATRSHADACSMLNPCRCHSITSLVM
jgi:hypothetical protein